MTTTPSASSSTSLSTSSSSVRSSIFPPIDQMRSYLFSKFIKDPEMKTLLDFIVEQKEYVDCHTCYLHQKRNKCGKGVCATEELEHLLFVYCLDDGQPCTSLSIGSHWVSPFWEIGRFHHAWPLFMGNGLLKMSIGSSAVKFDPKQMKVLMDRKAEIQLDETITMKNSEAIKIPIQTLLLVLSLEEFCIHWKNFCEFSNVMNKFIHNENEEKEKQKNDTTTPTIISDITPTITSTITPTITSTITPTIISTITPTTMVSSTTDDNNTDNNITQTTKPQPGKIKSKAMKLKTMEKTEEESEAKQPCQKKNKTTE